MFAEDLVMLAVLVVINAVVDTLIVLVILSRRQERMMGVKKVTNRMGETVYATIGPDDEPIKIPVGTKEVDGETKVIMDYAGLAYTLPFVAADMAAIKVKMALLGAKGQISQAIKSKALAEGDQEALMAMLPKKVQGAIAIAKMLGIGAQRGEGEGPGVSRTSHGGKAI